MLARAWIVATTTLVACGGGSPADVDASDDASTDPVAACGLVHVYRRPSTDCGPVPPDSDAGVVTCDWFVRFGVDTPDGLQYRFSDAIVSGRFRCEGTHVIGTDSASQYDGTIDLATGSLLWEGLTYEPD